MTQLTLQELIDALAAAPNPDLCVADGFSDGWSYRGFYEHIAFRPSIQASIRSMLSAARSALNVRYSGYKGGSYLMTAETPCWKAERDSGEGVEITKEWLDAAIAGATHRTREAWLIEVNTDLTEGKGHNVPLALCSIEATANRMARGRNVQGSAGNVSPVKLIAIGGRWYGPVDILEPSAEDVTVQKATDASRAVVARAKAAGLNDADIEALRRA